MDILSQRYDFSKATPQKLVSKEQVNKELARAARFDKEVGDPRGHMKAFQQLVGELLSRIDTGSKELTSYTQQKAAIVANKMASDRHLPENWAAEHFHNTPWRPIKPSIADINAEMEEISRARAEGEHMQVSQSLYPQYTGIPMKPDSTPSLEKEEAGQPTQPSVVIPTQPSQEKQSDQPS